MSQYYTESQWPGAGPAAAANWDHQTPPPPRSGASSVIPREESAAFLHQLEEVERAIDNLMKSGKMFGPPGRHGRVSSGPIGPRSLSVSEFSDHRGSHSGPNLQNFYAAQRHQSSRGSNEAEQMMQAKRRMAAQRERELRNYHQEQQYNRNVLADVSYNSGNTTPSNGNSSKPDRTMSPGGGMSEDERRDLIARQRSALYEGGASATSASQRGSSPLAYDYGRGSAAPGSADGLPHARADSNPSPQSNPSMGVFDAAVGPQVTRTSNSSPTGNSPPPQGLTGAKSGQAGNAVAPIGTRPSGPSQASNPAFNKHSTTPIPSPLSQSFTGDDGRQMTSSGAPSNPSSAAPDGYNGWNNRPGVWGNKSALGVQASVWG